MKTVNINFIRHNIAPTDGKLIGVFDSENKLVANINIDKLKKQTEDPIYKFGVLSDVHQNESKTAEPYVDFQNALNLFKEQGIKNVLICGDITENFKYTERSEFIELKNKFEEDGESKIFTTTGNHDCIGKTNEDTWNSQWLETSGLEKTCEIEELKYIHSNGKTDHFILLGMNKYSLGSSGKPYTDKDIEWLSTKLEEYKKDRCFIFTHLFFHHKAGNFKYSYPTGNYLLGSQFVLLNDLNNKYKNTFWFSGHSHWKYNLQKYQKSANVFGKHCGWNIHVSSCASPITSKFMNGEAGNNNSGWSRTAQPYDSEGLIVEVYEDYIITKGIVFKEGGSTNKDVARELKFVPCATYKLYPGSGDVDYLSDIDFSKINYIKASDFTLNPVKGGNNNSYPKVTQLDDDYVEVIFNNASQGFYIKPESFLPRVKTDINKHNTLCFPRVDDLKIFIAPYTDTTQRTQLSFLPSYVGFYGNTRLYTNEAVYGIYNDFNISTNEGFDGAACFQTSSQFISQNQETLHVGSEENDNVFIVQMKVKLAFEYEQ